MFGPTCCCAMRRAVPRSSSGAWDCMSLQRQPALLRLPAADVELRAADAEAAHPACGRIQRAPGFRLALARGSDQRAAGRVSLDMKARAIGDDAYASHR